MRMVTAGFATCRVRYVRVRYVRVRYVRVRYVRVRYMFSTAQPNLLLIITEFATKL